MNHYQPRLKARYNESDPDVRVFMLSDLTKEIGVIIFFNTSLGENEEEIYFDIHDELYKLGQVISTEKKTKK